MNKTGKTILVLSGIATVVTTAVLLLKKPAKASTPPVKPPPAGTNLTVTLTGLNPLATVWQMSIFNHSYTKILNTGSNSIPVAQSAAFTVPADWDFPLKIIISVYKDTVPGVPSALTQIVDVQSFDQTRADYKAIFINALGDIAFNCTTGNFGPPLIPPLEPPPPFLHNLAMIFYGQHTPAIDAAILAAKPALLIDNTPAGLWHANCNSAMFQGIGIKVFSYIYYAFGQNSPAPTINGTIINNANNEAFIRAIAAEGTKGVFIDCVNPRADAGITALCQYAHSLGLLVMVNAGVSPTDESLYAIADYVMVEEDYTGQAPTSTETNYLAQSIPIGSSPGWTAQQAAQYSNDAWAQGFMFTYHCQEYVSLPPWLATYISLLNK